MMTPSPLTTHDRTVGAAYPVTLPVFEGPLDLLLQLIEKEELAISEVSLLAVTDQYLRTIDHLEEVDPGALADFLVIASKLLYLKSVSLLPKPQPPLEDDEEDVGDALIRQLLEYRRFKQAAQLLQERQEQGLRVFVRTAPKPELERRLDLSNLDVNKLHQALRRVLNRMPSDPPMPRVKTYPITVAEQIDNVRSFLRTTQDRRHSINGAPAAPVTFVELLSRETTRMEVVVTFLAVLELIKQREVHAEQDGVFGDIVLVLDETSEGAVGPSMEESRVAA
jgi:segregation and condensation protein A